MNLTLPVSGAWRTTAIDLGQWLPGGSADGRNRRISPVPVRPGEGPLSEPRAGAQLGGGDWSSCSFATLDPFGDASYPAIAAIGRSGIVRWVLAGDTRRILGQVVGDREPRRFVDDKRVCVGADAGVVVERRQRDTIERRGAGVGLRAARVFVEFHQHRRATHFAEAAMRARRRLIERDQLLAGEKAEIGGGDPRPRAEWRAMRFLALRAMAMGGSHQGAVNLEAHLAA